MISKSIILLLSAYICVSTVSSYVVTWTGDDDLNLNAKSTERPLLGKKMCTRGPAYWCHNITHAKECSAVHHCISKVWQDMTLPEDNDSVCQICKDMVKQARDQLLSNETQDELRQVLEGSCKLIPLKVITEECIKLSDEFIPELVDTLASRMDPQAVCAVSGLCNSARIDEMLGEMKPLEIHVVPAKKNSKFDLSKDSCPKCNFYLGKSVQFLRRLSEDDLMEKLLLVCGRLGSYSDSCSSLVFSHLEDIYNHVQTRMNSDEMCGLVGLCDDSSVHRVQIGSGSTSVRVWTPPKDDNLECDFCKQLVVHVKEWLTANTTRDEFRDLLRGICKQTGKFRKECLNLAQQYGKPLYQLLVDETDPDRICGQIGVCPSQSKFKLFGDVKSSNGPIMTILPNGGMTLGADDDIIDDWGSDEQLDTMPMVGLLPAERLTGDDEKKAILGNNATINPKDKPQCAMCEYALHFLQNYIEDPKTEEKVTEAVDRLCSVLPQEMNKECTQFVNDYGKSIITLFAQEMDPSKICPELGACDKPKEHLLGGGDIERERPPIVRKDQKPKYTDVPTCPLCHFAVAKVINMVGANRTKEAIDKALDSVCYVMPHTLKSDCLNFMTYYGNQIGEMLVISFTAREVCMALHLCVLPSTSHKILPPAAPTKPLKIVVDSALPFDRFMPPTILKGEVENLKQKFPGLFKGDLDEQDREIDASFESDEINNEVGHTTVGGNQCVICEFVITQLDQRLENNATEKEIRDAVEHACDYLPKTVRQQCKDFVDDYSDMVINYLAQEMDPAEICAKIGLCKTNNKIGVMRSAIHELDQIKDVTLGRCQLCMVLSDYLSAMLEDPKVETSVDKIAEKICPIMPTRYRSECKDMIEDYGPYLMSLLAQATDKGKPCAVLSLCPSKSGPNYMEDDILL